MKILVVGSSLIDLFLKVENTGHVEVEGGKALFDLGDKVPVGIKKLGLGGNGANVSVGLVRLGAQTTFYTYLGTDVLSKEIQETLEREKVRILCQKNDSGENTPLSVILDFNSDRIVFSNHPKKNHDFEHGEGNYDFVYLTSIGDVWEGVYKKVMDFARARNIDLVFSPGSKQMDSINDVFMETLRNCKLLFVNKEEASRILEAKGAMWQDVKDMLSRLRMFGPEIVSVTDGENGAYADDGVSCYHIKSLKTEGAEKTGVGDAYASGFLGARLLGKDVAECMRWGVLNASSVIKRVGAQEGLLREDEIKDLLEQNLEVRAETI